jgi:hypothetical protein
MEGKRQRECQTMKDTHLLSERIPPLFIILETCLVTGDLLYSDVQNVIA